MEVDEIGLAVRPIRLGSGKPLFKNIKERTYLKLAGVKTYSTGIYDIYIRKATNVVLEF